MRVKVVNSPDYMAEYQNAEGDVIGHGDPIKQGEFAYYVKFENLPTKKFSASELQALEGDWRKEVL